MPYNDGLVSSKCLSKSEISGPLTPSGNGSKNKHLDWTELGYQNCSLESERI